MFIVLSILEIKNCPLYCQCNFIIVLVIVSIVIVSCYRNFAMSVVIVVVVITIYVTFVVAGGIVVVSVHCYYIHCYGSLFL